MNSGIGQDIACDPQAPSVRGMAGEIINQLERLNGGVNSLTHIMQQAGLLPLPTPVEGVGGCQPDTPRDTSLTATLRDAEQVARQSCVRLEELNATLERELL